MNRLGLLLALVCLSLQAGEFPVDDAIAELRGKADYLETMKQVFKSNDCSVTVNSNTVKLDPGALRSEGLVMAIGPGFPGNYLAYDRAPKPEFLENVVLFTVKKNGAGKGALIITARLQYTDDKPTSLAVYSAEPQSIKEMEGAYMYQKSGVALKLTDGKLSGSVSSKTALGLPLNVTCK